MQDLTPMHQSDLHSDEILLHGLAGGDPVSFRIIYRLHWRKLYDIAFHIMRNEADAEDIVQDVFSSLWYRREQLRIRIALENYLVRAVKYTAFFYLKVQARKPISGEHLPRKSGAWRNNTEENLLHKELEAMIEQILNTLPFKTKKIFFLSRFEGLTYPEIASEMDISIKTVEYHISMALKKFSKGLFYVIMLTSLG